MHVSLISAGGGKPSSGGWTCLSCGLMALLACTGRLCPLACYISGCWSFGVFVAWISAWGRCLDAFLLIWMLLAGGREPEVLALPDLLGLAVARVQQEMLGKRGFWVHRWPFAGSAGGAAQKGGSQCGS